MFIYNFSGHNLSSRRIMARFIKSYNFMKQILLVLMIPIVFTACDAITGKEIGRLPVNRISTDDNIVEKTLTLDLTRGQTIAIWSDMDMKYKGDVNLYFRLKVLKNGGLYSDIEFDPRQKNITIGEIKKVIMDQTDWSYTGKNLEMEIDESGQYTFQAALFAYGGPIKIREAEIILKK